MHNVGCPFFVIIGDRARCPEGTGIGNIKNVKAVDIRAEVINPDVRPEITVDDVKNFQRAKNKLSGCKKP